MKGEDHNIDIYIYTTMVGLLPEKGTKQKGKKRQGVRKGES